MYPDDPRLGRRKTQRSVREQILVVLIAVGVAVVVTLFAGLVLYFAELMK